MTKEEIQQAATEYRNKVIAEDKEYGYTRENLCYGDIKRAFMDGAEWSYDTIKKYCTPQFDVEPKIPTKVMTDFIDEFFLTKHRPPHVEDFLLWQMDKDIKKACDWFNSVSKKFEDEYVSICGELTDTFFEDFRKAMEE